ncbi:MAG: PEP-CTERM sorting domain-containing protein [Planctomycetota bacterium]
MKKFVISLFVFGLTSAAGATTLSWDVGSTYDLDYTTGGTVHIASDDDQPYQTVWIDDTDGFLITNISCVICGPEIQATIVPPEPEYPGWWSVEVADTVSPFSIPSGNQFVVQLAATSAMNGNTYGIVLDAYSPHPVGGPTTLTVTVVPEPGTLALIGLGGVLLLRRGKKIKGG